MKARTNRIELTESQLHKVIKESINETVMGRPNKDSKKIGDDYTKIKIQNLEMYLPRLLSLVKLMEDSYQVDKYNYYGTIPVFNELLKMERGLTSCIYALKELKKHLSE